MRRWLRGKGGGFLALVTIAGLVVGGLGWVTAQTLRLEEQQRETLAAKELSQAETDQAHKVRLALWRLDTHVYTDLANEANRPYHEYTAQVACVPVGSKNRDNTKALTILELLTTRGDDAPAWMRHSYVVALESDWSAPQVMREDLVRHLNLSRKAAGAKKAPTEDPVLALINRDESFPEYLNQVRQQEPEQQQGGSNPAVQQTLPFANPGARSDMFRSQQPGQVKQQGLNYQNQRGTYDPDTAARLNRAASDKGVQSYPNNTLMPGTAADNNRAKDDKQPVVVLGPISPLWLSGPQDQLILARLVQLGRKPACQVTVLDWPVLRAELLGQVQDLLPDATLVPDPPTGTATAPEERAMTALPVRLDPGPILVEPPAWDGASLRYGLALAWAAALVGILAVALGGWALLDLSERRIGFVSAVTHELRTPLTSLRLYLDMLTSGLVTDEKQKDEYLHTLNAETDRLNRLVGNVLDFSRLENQRPKLSLSYFTVADLLYHLRSTWEGRCHDSAKELVIENDVGPDALLQSDEQMVQQILGNLIDNACKYTSGAEDPRVFVRARADGTRLVLEVEDRGPGVPVAERRSIFRAFRRGRGADVAAGGVGLGLALAQRWTGLLGGTLTLEACTASVGARFQVVLPGLSL